MNSDGDSEVMCVRYSPDKRILAAGYADGYVKVSQFGVFLYLHF